MTKICTVIAEKNKGDIAKALEDVAGADVVELRLDYLSDISEGLMEEVIKSTKLPKIVTIRSKRDGGFFEGGEETRVHYLKKAIDYGADYIDLELSTDTGWRYEVLKKAKEKKCKVIVSFHDFEGTPDQEALVVKIEDAYAAGGGIAKIATHAKNMDDALSVLSIVQRYRGKGKDIIGIAMGDQGQVTRLPWKNLGSYLTYVSVSKPEEGQFTLNTALKLREILDGSV